MVALNSIGFVTSLMVSVPVTTPDPLSNGVLPVIMSFARGYLATPKKSSDSGGL